MSNWFLSQMHIDLLKLCNQNRHNWRSRQSGREGRAKNRTYIQHLVVAHSLSLLTRVDPTKIDWNKLKFGELLYHHEKVCVCGGTLVVRPEELVYMQLHFGTTEKLCSILSLCSSIYCQITTFYTHFPKKLDAKTKISCLQAHTDQALFWVCIYLFLCGTASFDQGRV